MPNKLVISIDGPAGAGKSTIAKKLSKILRLNYVDSGAMYRALTLKVLNLGINPEDTKEILNIMDFTSIDIRNGNVYLDGTSVNKEIRKNIINNYVSIISKIEEVRNRMVKIQRRFAETNGVVMDGRDIGTVVLPNADYKFFVTASIEERARRRYKELIERQEGNITFNQILLEITDRDRIDSTRKIAPLKKSEDAYLIDSTNRTVEQCIEEIISIIKRG